MKRLLRLIALVTLPLACALPAAHAEGPQRVAVRDWDVYVDLPTGFAFVNTPRGWVFVRQLDAEQMARLPASTLTALLLPDDSDVHYAHPALEPSPRTLAQRAAQTRMAAGPASRAQ